MLTVLPWTLSSILKGIKKGSCSCCDKGNTSSGQVSTGEFLGKGEEPRERSREVWTSQTQSEGQQGASHRCWINAFGYDWVIKVWCSCQAVSASSPVDAFGKLDPDLFGGLDCWRNAVPLGSSWMGSHASWLSHTPLVLEACVEHLPCEKLSQVCFSDSLGVATT